MNVMANAECGAMAEAMAEAMVEATTNLLIISVSAYTRTMLFCIMILAVNNNLNIQTGITREWSYCGAACLLPLSFWLGA